MLQFLAVSMSLLASIQQVRSTYKLAYENSGRANTLVEMTKPHQGTAVMLAYYGTGLAFQANHSWNPATKLSKASEANSKLNAAANMAPNDLEVIFLRFSFETKAPAFLGYSTHVKADKAKLMELKNTQHPMWSWMHAFFLQCPALTASEKQKL